MKIAIDIKEAAGTRAGKGNYTFYMVKELIRLAPDWQFFLYSKEKVKGLEAPNVTEVILDNKSIFWHFNLAKDLKSKEVDFFFSPTSYITPLFVSRKIKTILTVHDLISFLFPQGHNLKAKIIEKLTLRFALKKAFKIACVSNATATDLKKIFRVKDDKILITHCAASDLPKENFKNLKDYEYFLSVGTIIPRKNYLRIIEAFADYNKQFPNTKLVIVGKKGWQSDEVFELVQKLNIEEKVVFEDYVSGKELSALYLHAKALIFTSLYEGFGIPSLEAMSLGCPVIASDQKAIAEVTENAAVLVDPTDKYAISAAMLELEIRPEKRKELIKKGFHQNMKFNWKKSAEKLYNQIKS